MHYHTIAREFDSHRVSITSDLAPNIKDFIWHKVLKDRKKCNSSLISPTFLAPIRLYFNSLQQLIRIHIFIYPKFKSWLFAFRFVLMLIYLSLLTSPWLNSRTDFSFSMITRKGEGNTESVLSLKMTLYYIPPDILKSRLYSSLHHVSCVYTI